MADQSTRRRWFLPLALVAACFALAGGIAKLAWIRDHPLNGIRVEELEADLEARVPDGSTAAQAEEWFASQEIDCNRFANRKGLWVEVPNDTLWESAVIQVIVALGPDGQVRGRLVRRIVRP